MTEKCDILKILDMDVTELELCREACDILINNKIEIVDEIVSYTEEEMLHILGKREYLEEIAEKLSVLGVSFKNSAERNDIAKTIEDLDLSVRAYNVLKRAGINTVEDLVYADLSEVRGRIGLNRKVLDEILLKLEESGLQLQENANKEVEELGFTPKLAIILRRNGINTAKDLSRENLLNIRRLPHVGRKVFKEIVLKLDELGFNPIDTETRKIEKLQKLIEKEKRQDIASFRSIEIENIEVNKYCQLDVTFSIAPTEEWIKIFDKVRTRYFSEMYDSSECINSAAKTTAKKLINEIKLTVDLVTSYCSAEDILKTENHKEILIYFIEYLNAILKLTQKEYIKNIRVASIKSKQLEIDEALWNIEFMKSVFSERDKLVEINNELSDLINKEKKTLI